MSSHSFADALRAVERFLPEKLLSSPSWTRGLSLASQLPVTISPYAFGFEAPLHLPMTGMELALCITQPGCDILAGKHPRLLKSVYLDQSALWSDVKKFCKVWRDAKTSLFRAIENLWLEFRLHDRDASFCPVPFLKFRDDCRSNERVHESLDILCGNGMPEVVGTNLRNFIDKLPGNARIAQAGVGNVSGDCRIRLCLEGIPARQLPVFLKDMEIESPHGLDPGLLGRMGRIVVHVDIGKSLGTSVGIEIRQHPEKELSLATQSEWDALLDFLEKEKLCLSENNSFLKSFRGSTYLMLHPEWTRFTTIRLLYYIKLVYSPEKGIHAKGYFGFINKAFIPPLERDGIHYGTVHTRLSQGAVTAAVRRGKVFLIQNQLPHGEFCTYIAGDERLANAEFAGSVFGTSFVLYCTRHLKGADMDQCRSLSRSFLLREGTEDCLWKYWTNASNRSIVCDLDDTCCISFVLKDLFKMSRVKTNIPIILSNRIENGLFKTWLKEKQARNDTDIAVNANVILYLGERDETRKTISFLRDCLINGYEMKYCHYYPDIMACYYMISRLARHGFHALDGVHELVRARVMGLMGPEGHWRNDLSTALAICTLNNIKSSVPGLEKALLWLVGRQQANGSWGRAAFFTGPEAPVSRSAWFGSEELTTAFCMEALCGAGDAMWDAASQR